PLATVPADVVDRYLGQDRQLRAERRDHGVDLAVHGLAARPDTVDLADDLRKLDQVTEPRRPGRPLPVLPVGQRLDPVQHAHGQWLAALRAAPAGRPGLLGIPAHLAVAVPVGVVLALLREELDRAAETLARLQRPPDREVVDLGLER